MFCAHMSYAAGSRLGVVLGVVDEKAVTGAVGFAAPEAPELLRLEAVDVLYVTLQRRPAGQCLATNLTLQALPTWRTR